MSARPVRAEDVLAGPHEPDRERPATYDGWGDRDPAVAALFRAHYQHLVALAGRILMDFTGAEDVVMDAFLPGVGEWEAVYNDPGFWHFRFHGPTPEALVRGRERAYFEHYWNDFAADKAHSLSEADRAAYSAAYARPGRMRAGWAYFAAWPQTANDFAEMAKTKLNMPLLAIAGEKASASTLMPQAQLVGTNVSVVTIKDSGHWVMEEKQKETIDALLNFL